jgi:two-component system, OmpR family, sensor histidine kinase MtrB
VLGFESVAISIRRGFALVGGLVALLEAISIAVLITVALNGRNETVHALDELKRGDRDLVAAWKADTESALDYRIIEGLAIAEVAVLLLGGGVTVWLLHRNVYRPLLDLDASIARYTSSPGERTHAAVTGPSEIRRIASTFNVMIDKVADQERREAAFLAGIAHDIRNPLMVIRGSTEVLVEQQGTPSPASIGRSCERILRQVERMEQMLTDFVDARGIESGMLELTPTDNDIAELARDVTDRFRAVAPAHELVLEAPPGPVTARCDGLRLEQVLVNLITNAIKYSPGGGRVVVAARANGEWATVSVSDQGIGIAADQQDSIFEPFRRVAPASSGIAGSGLGLAVSKQIVERHGGRIEVDSALGRGTTFRVLIPSREDVGLRRGQRA